jgi:hypothetical protein
MLETLRVVASVNADKRVGECAEIVLPDVGVVLSCTY